MSVARVEGSMGGAFGSGGVGAACLAARGAVKGPRTVGYGRAIRHRISNGAAVPTVAPMDRPAPADLSGYSDQPKNCAPLALIVEPEMNPASSEARNTTQRAISSGSPRRPTGICGMMRSFSTFSSMARTISVPM